MTRTFAGLITDPIGETEARFIAQDWHGGQWSALYGFASSGHLDAHGALAEAERAYRENTTEDDYQLIELIDYLERNLPTEDDE